MKQLEQKQCCELTITTASILHTEKISKRGVGEGGGSPLLVATQISVDKSSLAHCLCLCARVHVCVSAQRGQMDGRNVHVELVSKDKCVLGTGAKSWTLGEVTVCPKSQMVVQLWHT